MQIKVRIFIDNKQVKPSELRNLTIKNTTVDRIVNDVVERNHPEDSKTVAKAS
jgi:hypothetical protein